MLVKELMTKEIISIQPIESIQAAIRKMRTSRIGFLVVIDEANKIKGVITDRDILLSIDDDYKMMDSISYILKPNVIVINENSGVNEAAEILGYYQIKRLVVVNDFGEAVGIFSIADIVRNPECREYALDALIEITSDDSYPLYSVEKDNILLSDSFSQKD